MLNSIIVANRRPLCNRGPSPAPARKDAGGENKKKKDILSDVLLGALEEIRTPDLLIRSQTLYPTELPAQVQDIYYHRPRGLSTVFAKKYKVFFAKQKRFFCPLRAAAGGPFFRPQTDSLLAPPCARGCPVGLRQPCGASRPAIQSAPLPRPAAALCPAPPHGREKARPLQKERPGLVHFSVRR